jgi:hypothetical protein
VSKGVKVATAYYSSLLMMGFGSSQSYPNAHDISVSDVPDSFGRYTISFLVGPVGFQQFQLANHYGFTAAGSPVFALSPAYFLVPTNDPSAEPEPTLTPPYYGVIATQGAPFVACFLTGARIATPQGEAAVEALSRGDLVMTADGREVAVKWVGRQSVSALFAAEHRAPIHIAAGALGDNRPVRDLQLTADHALLLDGMLVQAGVLVNGTTIRRMTRAETGERYVVWHIETEAHDIILAEGCPAETFVDNISRRRFDNYVEYEALFGADADAMVEMDLPRVKSARQAPVGLRDRITTRQAA